MEDEFDTFQGARIAVVGVGGQGCNAVTRLYNSNIKSAETIAINTDLLHLRSTTKAHKKLLIGKEITNGLGAGGFPEIAKRCVEISKDQVIAALEGYNLVFLCAGMGGGTGTGAAPVIGRIAKELGALVVAIVTYPFQMEKNKRATADEGLKELVKEVDSTIVIENEKLLSYVPNLPLEKAFEAVDTIIGNAVKGIADTISFPSLIQLDYADLRSVLLNSGTAVISIGSGAGNDRVEQAIRSTRSHPLLSVDYKGAKGALVHITSGYALTIDEARQIGEGVTSELAPDANVIFGARLLPELKDEIRVMSLITGVEMKLAEKKEYSEERSSSLDLDLLQPL
ncbi:MAG: cell division protein FtsZ [Candidatus Micrarchaeaceae archaeon]